MFCLCGSVRQCGQQPTFLSLSSLVSTQCTNDIFQIFDFSTIRRARVQTWVNARHSDLCACVCACELSMFMKKHIFLPFMHVFVHADVLMHVSMYLVDFWCVCDELAWYMWGLTFGWAETRWIVHYGAEAPWLTVTFSNSGQALWRDQLGLIISSY